jgi:hypothetical protein
MMNWTIGNYYETRNGCKVVLLWIADNSGSLLFLRLDTTATFWSSNDGLYHNPDRPHDLDIVSEWRDPARVTVEWYVSTRSGLYQVWMAGTVSRDVLEDGQWKLIGRCEIVEGEGM